MEFLGFARYHKAWWILPIIVMFLLVALLIVVGQTGSPYIYTLLLNEVTPEIRTQIIPDAGHDLTIVAAPLVNSLATEFLTRVPQER